MFNKEYLDNFLGVIRKYMHVRGNLSQKDLAELAEVGVSTMSRFLNKKTHELDVQLIAKIVTRLNIPLHEIIDFILEEYAVKFKKLVNFIRDQDETTGLFQLPEDIDEPVRATGTDNFESTLSQTLRNKRSDKEGVQSTRAHIKVGGQSRTIPFGPTENVRKDKSFKEKIDELTPRQKAYLQDFMNMDMEAKDVMVDVGNSLFRFFRQKGMEF